MAFPENFIQELIDRNDIVDVIGSYVNLSKRSGANLFGLCPFHNERTPSFAVNPSGQFYHCFGCGKGGGVINFIMEIENLSYPDAVRHLAARVGMEVPDDGYDKDSKRRARLLELNRDAAKFFYEQLSVPDGQKAVRYMQERGISPQTAKRFGLGYAPDSWESLRKAMTEKDYSDFELFDAGLVKRGQRGGFYDTFRNRLMFPVIDVRGDVIGFSGRILGGDGAKYMNSPDTLVYNKSRNLFAMNLAKKSKSGYLLLAEGNVDVVTLHQAGFDSAVASLGTSLTPEQARLMSRYTKEVIIAYDNDSAGQKAAQRAIGILERLDLKVRVLRMTGAKDPDEFIRTKGADAFANLLKDSENQVDYRLNTVKAKYDLSLDDQKVSYLKEASELLARLPGQVERQVYAIRVAGEAGIGQDAVIREVERRRKILLSRLKKDYERDITRPEKSVQPAERTMRYSNPGAAAAEEGIIRLLYLEPALAREELPDAEEFSSEALGKIYSVLRDLIESGASVSVNALAPKLGQEEMNLLVRIIQKPERLSESRSILADYVRRMREEQDRKSGSEDLKALSEKLRKEKAFRP
ncbi:MAG: DNA primase [Oscillospiraceae bacterium]|nr:DNA primase [Oscillospiraceae bacterium]